MLNENTFANAQSLIDSVSSKPKNVKIIRKEAGLIERTQNEEKIILSEDNRQILFG